MPTHKQQVAGRLCKETGIARNAFTSKIDKVLGTAHDLLMRLRRLANTSEQRDDTTKEQRKAQNEKTMQIRADLSDGNVEGAESKPNEYDNNTAGKTLWRLSNATRIVRETIAKV